ncbi:hypothetical protein BDQ17DRAFT_1418801 [Cyathus striatus]|nr:hypothetical protein BDQ17DRAFT_1418801 [Cyathus striatus]
MPRKTLHTKLQLLSLQPLVVTNAVSATLDDIHQCSSPSSSESSVDDDDVNRRMTPYWPRYQNLFLSRGFQLDRVRDVTEFYRSHGVNALNPAAMFINKLGLLPDQDDALCPDAGLPENLFRGTQISNRKKVVVKAVHILSREYDINRLLSVPPLKNDPMNHTIPILDLVEVHEDQVAFIVMEEWSSQLVVTDCPCCVPLFLSALRQCIEVACCIFAQAQHSSSRYFFEELLTDYSGNYAYTDYELSRRFDGVVSPLVYGYRGTEVPPDCESGTSADPYKIDVWALGVLILRACNLTNHNIPEILQLVKPMLNEHAEERPSMNEVLKMFDALAAIILLKRNRQ